MIRTLSHDLVRLLRRCGRLRATPRVRAMACFALLAVASPGSAQLGLPPAIEVPRLPVELPDIERPVAGVRERLDPRELRRARLLRVRELLRRHRDVLEADPAGAPMLRSELLAFAPGEGALERAKAAGFEVLREVTFEALATRLVVLRAPPRVSTRRALRQLRELDPAGNYDFNHLYLESGEVDAPPRASGSMRAAASGAPGGNGATSSADPPLRIGLIDGGVEGQHPALAGVEIQPHGCEGKLVPSVHGTAVASLLAGRSDAFQGAAVGAKLFAADVYCGRPFGGSVAAVASALDWMARERVPVINVSLVGPRNVALGSVIAGIVARGHLVVAAVGNDGPAAGPLYPASYPGVVGVTAVDARQRVLVEAGRGPQVDFAAPGADMLAAGPSQSLAPVRGTSFAAPLVAGLLAPRMSQLDQPTAEAAVAALAAGARDLGSPGTDVIYGRGLVGEGLRVGQAAAELPASQ